MSVQANPISVHLAQRAREMESVLSDILPKGEGAQAQINEAMRYAVLGGGKRLRPFLMIETSRLFGAPEQGIYRAAAALECVHVYSLIHDDLPCMDDDDLRRGKPTVHKAYDEAMAVLTGDALLTLAFEILVNEQTHSSADTRINLVGNLAKCAGVNGMIGGQVMDIYASERILDEEMIRTLQSLKTGALIKYAVDCGAIYGQASTEERRSLEIYADRLGLAFQIRDDVLDAEGDAIAMGKNTGKDARQGKATFVSIWGLKKAKEKAIALGEEAKQALGKFGARANLLKDTVDFVVQREK